MNRDSLAIPNFESSYGFWESPTDAGLGRTHHGAMPMHTEDWHLRDWMQHFGKKQAALVNELGWDKAKANFLWHSKQPYRRDIVNEVSQWLGIRPFELLMPPEEALAYRRFREAAAAIASEAPIQSTSESPPAPRRRAAAPAAYR